MPVLIIWKFNEDLIKMKLLSSGQYPCQSDEDSIKNEIAIFRTTFSEVYGPSKSEHDIFISSQDIDILLVVLCFKSVINPSLAEHDMPYLKKPTDLHLHSLLLNMPIYIKNLDQVIWLAGN